MDLVEKVPFLWAVHTKVSLTGVRLTVASKCIMVCHSTSLIPTMDLRKVRFRFSRDNTSATYSKSNQAWNFFKVNDFIMCKLLLGQLAHKLHLLLHGWDERTRSPRLSWVLTNHSTSLAMKDHPCDLKPTFPFRLQRYAARNLHCSLCQKPRFQKRTDESETVVSCKRCSLQDGMVGDDLNLWCLQLCIDCAWSCPANRFITGPSYLVDNNAWSTDRTGLCGLLMA
jgi:hypothetical protein